MPSPRKPRPVPPGCDPRDPNRIVRKAEAEWLTSLSWSTIKKRYPHLIIPLSPGCTGIKVGSCYAIRAFREAR
jgi:hypothetical protein